MPRFFDRSHSIWGRPSRILHWHHSLFSMEVILGLTIIVGCICAASAVLGQSADGQLPHRDQESWPELDLSCRTGARVNVTVIAQSRLSTDLPNPVLWLLGVDNDVLVNRHFLITPSYYYFRFDQPGSTAQGHNLVLAATFTQGAGRLRIDDRNRMIGFLITRNDFWAYGNRLRFTFPIGPEEKRVSLFAWDELFFFSSTSSWQRNRMAFGVHDGLTDRVAIEPYFLHQTDGHLRPGHLNTFGLVLKAKIH
jgi:hypothetical protein